MKQLHRLWAGGFEWAEEFEWASPNALMMNDDRNTFHEMLEFVLNFPASFLRSSIIGIHP